MFQHDPMGYEDSVNLYAGLGWDPVNNRDLTGMVTEEVLKECMNQGHFRDVGLALFRSFLSGELELVQRLFVPEQPEPDLVAPLERPNVLKSLH